MFKLAWSKNGTPDTLSGTGDTLQITDLTAYKFNVFLTHGITSGGQVVVRGHFDSDTGNNYSSRTMDNGGTEETDVSIAYVRMAAGIGPSGSDSFLVTYVSNIDGEEKLVISFIANTLSSGAGYAPYRGEAVCKYNDGGSNPQFTAFDANNAGSGDFAAGTNLTAIGTD